MWFVVFIFVLIHSVTSVFAGSFSISGVPESVDATTPFDVEYTYVCSGCEKKNNYFFGALKAADSNRFFGLNQVGDQWINYEEEKNALLYFLSSPSAEGTWSGKLTVKPINPINLSSYFKGAGNYILKVFRFTPSSSSDSMEVPIALTYTIPATPTPIPSPSPTSTPTPTAAPTPKPTPNPTSLSTPTPTPKSTPMVTPSPIPTQIATETAIIVDQPITIATVAGVSTEPKVPRSNTFIPLFITFGGICVLAGIMPIGWHLIQEK